MFCWWARDGESNWNVDALHHEGFLAGCDGWLMMDRLKLSSNCAISLTKGALRNPTTRRAAQLIDRPEARLCSVRCSSFLWKSPSLNSQLDDREERRLSDEQRWWDIIKPIKMSCGFNRQFCLLSWADFESNSQLFCPSTQLPSHPLIHLICNLEIFCRVHLRWNQGGWASLMTGRFSMRENGDLRQCLSWKCVHVALFKLHSPWNHFFCLSAGCCFTKPAFGSANRRNVAERSCELMRTWCEAMRIFGRQLKLWIRRRRRSVGLSMKQKTPKMSHSSAKGGSIVWDIQSHEVVQLKHRAWPPLSTSQIDFLLCSLRSMLSQSTRNNFTTSRSTTPERCNRRAFWSGDCLISKRPVRVWKSSWSSLHQRVWLALLASTHSLSIAIKPIGSSFVDVVKKQNASSTRGFPPSHRPARPELLAFFSFLWCALS